MEGEHYICNKQVEDIIIYTWDLSQDMRLRVYATPERRIVTDRDVYNQSIWVQKGGKLRNQ